MNRAQSSVLGFVFVFALIALTVGVTYTVGLSSLQDAQEAERIENVERAFEVFAANVDDLVAREVPSRATEMRLAGGSLGVTEPTTVRLEVVNTTDSSDNATYEATSRPVEFADADTKIAYSHGAVLRSDDGAAVMLSEPEWLVDEDRAVVPLVVTVAGGDTTSVGGQRTVLVVTELKSRGVIGAFTTGPNSQARVNVTVQSPKAVAWKRYFEGLGFTAIDGNPDDGDVTYQFETDEVYVPRTTVAVEFA